LRLAWKRAESEDFVGRMRAKSKKWGTDPIAYQLVPVQDVEHLPPPIRSQPVAERQRQLRIDPEIALLLLGPVAAHAVFHQERMRVGRGGRRCVGRRGHEEQYPQQHPRPSVPTPVHSASVKTRLCPRNAYQGFNDRVTCLQT
jgi:hypothetical protein